MLALVRPLCGGSGGGGDGGARRSEATKLLFVAVLLNCRGLLVLVVNLAAGDGPRGLSLFGPATQSAMVLLGVVTTAATGPAARELDRRMRVAEEEEEEEEERGGGPRGSRCCNGGGGGGGDPGYADEAEAATCAATRRCAEKAGEEGASAEC